MDMIKNNIDEEVLRKEPLVDVEDWVFNSDCQDKSSCIRHDSYTHKLEGLPEDKNKHRMQKKKYIIEYL